MVADDLAGYIGVDRGLVLDTFERAWRERQEKTVRAARGRRCAHEERMLLNALAGRCRTGRAKLIAGAAKRSKRCTRSRRARIFQAMFAHARRAAGRMHFEAVNARLEERDQNLLAEAVLRWTTGDSRGKRWRQRWTACGAPTTSSGARQLKARSQGSWSAPATGRKRLRADCGIAGLRALARGARHDVRRPFDSRAVVYNDLDSSHAGE